MDASEVAKILSSLGLRPAVNGYGFLLPATVMHGYKCDEDVRLERGSGIACRGHIWTLKEVSSGEAIGPHCSTKRELRRVLLEWLAGPKPPGAKYARWHKTRLDEGAIWCLDLAASALRQAAAGEKR